MKRFCALLLALNLASALAADDVLAEYEFRAAVREGRVSMHELARRLKAEAAKPGGTESREFVDLFAAATAKANDAELKELGEMIRALPENGLQFS